MEGQRQGFGIFNWTNGPFKGDSYEGEWKDDEKEGLGTYHYKSGDRLEA